MLVDMVSGESTECPTCGRDDFASRTGMKIHHTRIHNESLAGFSYTCEWCDNEYTISNQDESRRFCSKDCEADWRSNMIRGKNHPLYNSIEKICLHCGDLFQAKKSRASDRKYCSKSCAASDRTGQANPRWKKYPKKQCKQCGDVFEVKPSTEGRRKYCSKSCAASYRTGKDNPRWVDYVEIECEHCGYLFKVKPSVQSQSKFCSVECKGAWRSENYTGENNPNWKGGVKLNYGPKWRQQRRAALERDGYRCQECGKHKNDLDRMPHVHHVRPFRTFDDYETANRLENLITLCSSCHPSFERKPKITWYTA